MLLCVCSILEYISKLQFSEKVSFMTERFAFNTSEQILDLQYPTEKSLISMDKSDWLKVMWLETMALSYHGFVIEWKPLHRPECVCSTGDVTEYNKRLTSHLERLECDNVHDWPKLRENGIEWLLQFCMRVCVWWTEEGEKEGVENTRWIEKWLDMIMIYIHRLHCWVLLNLSEVWRTGSGFLTPTTCKYQGNLLQRSSSPSFFTFSLRLLM